MRRDQTQRIAHALGLVAVPRSGYITPETLAQVEREAEMAQRSIHREWERRQANRKQEKSK